MKVQIVAVFLAMVVMATAETKIPEYPFATVTLTASHNASSHDADYLLKCDFNITYPKHKTSGVTDNWEHEVGFWHTRNSSPDDFYQVGVYKSMFSNKMLFFKL